MEERSGYTKSEGGRSGGGKLGGKVEVEDTKRNIESS